MRIVKANPNKFFWTSPNIFDNIFDDTLWSSPVKQQKPYGVKIKDHEDRTEVSIAAPGIKKEDFDISLKDGVMTVSYEGSTEENPRVFSKHAFAKSWTLPKGTKTKDISAKYNAGILTVNIKKPAKVQPKIQSIKIV